MLHWNLKVGCTAFLMIRFAFPSDCDTRRLRLQLLPTSCIWQSDACFFLSPVDLPSLFLIMLGQHALAFSPKGDTELIMQGECGSDGLWIDLPFLLGLVATRTTTFYYPRRITFRSLCRPRWSWIDIPALNLCILPHNPFLYRDNIVMESKRRGWLLTVDVKLLDTFCAFTVCWIPFPRRAVGGKESV